ncbi:diguanylate cyclase [Caballeronia terrestris]|uniref:diguanylate cyclase n=1 Tax=Caballeronia terrestris TaxID=1226301 RepID=A0A158K932_9BURK|nr:sensor domain-containing diguanylate cyclase [Caballeronia terrestris]SAL77223.1 diguanylate cyclase [Caballeronia terrestris]
MKTNEWFIRQRDRFKCKESTALHGIVYGAALISLVMVGLCALVLYQSRQDAFERTRETSRNVALIAERDIVRNFELYDLSLQAVIEGLAQPEVMALPDHLRRDVLFDRAATAKYLEALLVLDEAGDIVVDSVSETPRKANFADSAFFKAQRAGDAGLYISDPLRFTLEHDMQSIVLSRRITRADGSFGGVAMIAISLDYFRNLFAGLSLGERGSASVIGQSGLMVMRQPYDVRIIGRDIKTASTFKRFIAEKEGDFSDTASIDNVRRLYTFKTLPHLPFIIMVAMAETDIYAAWRRRALTIGSLMATFGLAFVGLSAVLGTQLRRRMRAESELQLLARTDGLTGLNNRRTFGEVLDLEWRRARRARCVFSLLFVDIDRFKAYNDTYGHQAGDKALAAVAKCIGESIRRPGDTAARYGGEEFVVVLPNTPAAGASFIAEKIRVAISDLSLAHAGSEFGRVTASIGTASWDPESAMDVSDMLKDADRALYRAKAMGRNMVAFASRCAGEVITAECTDIEQGLLVR